MRCYQCYLSYGRVTPDNGGVTSKDEKIIKNQLRNTVSPVTQTRLYVCTWCYPLSRIANIELLGFRHTFRQRSVWMYASN